MLLNFGYACIAALVFAVPTFAQYNDCTPTPDLSEGMGPVYNQGQELSSCFANTAADQLTVRMHRKDKLPAKDRIQPLALWAFYTLNDSRLPNESLATVSTPNNLYTSIYRMRERGAKMLCKESEFGSGVNNKHPLFSQADAAVLAKKNEFQQMNYAGPCTSEAAISEKLDRQAVDLKNVSYFLWWDALKATCHTEIPNIGWRYYDDDVRFGPNQRNEERAWPPAANEKFGSEIDTALEKGSPAGIEYQAGFLLPNGKHFMHWSNIVQRLPKDGKCFYRIRDSFGEDCSRYKDPSRCEKGYLWVERDELMNHVDAVTYLK